MKEIIDKLSRGIIEYERPILEVSADSIEITMDVNGTKRAELFVRSGNAVPLKCVAYSTNECVKIINSHIVGLEGKIEYIIRTNYLEEDTVIMGSINIVSNGGEISVPYTINVEAESAETNIGKIKNMFHFANFVQTNYEEALQLFLSERFRQVFIERDLHLSSVYEGLMRNDNKSVALEQFLIATNKKKPVTLSLSEYEKHYSHPEETISDSVIVSKDNWGYINCVVECDCPFIKLSKTVLTSDDFAGSNYEFSYLVKPELLHDGLNYGQITIKTNNPATEDIKVSVVVDNTSEKSSEKAEYKRCQVAMEKCYLDFRMHKIDMNQWGTTMLGIIERMRAIDDDDYFPRLMQAQILISMRREADASWILENVAETLLEKRLQEPAFYCYYLYVRTLQKKEKEFTDEMKKKIWEIYDSGNNRWEILWLLLYMDDGLQGNYSLKLARIKEQFSVGMVSPVMYYEAAMVFCDQPAMLRVLNDFEIQVMNFAAKNRIVTVKLAAQFAELAMKERMPGKLTLNILKMLYKIYGDVTTLSSIVGILIRNGMTGPEYLYWYEEGINKELKIAGIYENYLYSAGDDYRKPLPHPVMLYFSYNTDVSNDRLAFLYASIIANKKERPSEYNTYLKQIERYAVLYMQAGKINRYLRVIYSDILSPEFITPELAEKLPDILCTHMIKCDSNNIKAVTVLHKELVDPITVPFINGVAYVRAYTDDVIYIFEDLNGNKFIDGVNYKIKKLFDMEDYLRMCYEISAQNIGLSMHFADEYVKYGKNAMKSVGILQLLIQMKEVREEYKRVIEKEIINYYTDNYDGDLLDDFLSMVDVSMMSAKLRKKVVELMIIRNHYNRAFGIIQEYGYMSIEPRRIMMFVSRAIEMSEYEEDELLLEMAAFAFDKGKYDEVVLDYLCRYYYGTTKEMVKIWEASNSFSFPSREIEERLLCQMLFSGTYLGRCIGNVYDSYYEKGPNEKIKRAYLISKAYDYFVYDKVVDAKIFEYIGKDISRDDECTDVCKLAYVRYYSNDSNIDKEIRDNAKKIIDYFCTRNIVFEFYKRYGAFFELPYMLEDKTIVEYRTSPGSKVYVNYVLETGNYEEKDYTVEEMRSVFPGVYIFETVLFYGESLVYYISEKKGNMRNITESHTLSETDRQFGASGSRYSVLNDIMVCQDMHEESTLADIAKNYYIDRMITEELFDIM